VRLVGYLKKKNMTNFGGNVFDLGILKCLVSEIDAIPVIKYNIKIPNH
jgi:hypothetical protein